jgi:cellobiose phosphorylase
MEPYVHGQFTESRLSPNEGASHVHWLTGTASTVMVGCVEGICGMRPDADGLEISPAVPSDWKEFEITKNFRGKKLHISFTNENGSEAGVRYLIVNGEKVDGCYLRADELKEENEITAVM